MKVMIWGDLHLNPVQAVFEKQVERLFCQNVKKEKPDLLVLNGDTFDLIIGAFFVGYYSPTEILKKILKIHESFAEAVNSIAAVKFIVGEHDRLLAPDDNFGRVIGQNFTNAEILDYWHEKQSNSLVFHGQQFSYDIEVCVYSQPISLTSSLTQALKEFFLSAQIGEEKLIEQYKKGEISFWYQSGFHGDFIKGMSKIYGCMEKYYYFKIARLLCEKGTFSYWAQSQPFVANRIVIRAARLAALVFCQNISCLAPLYWKSVNRVVRRRYLQALLRGTIVYPPHKQLGFKNLVTSHDHRAFSRECNGRRWFCTGSPKAQAVYENGEFKLVHGGSYVVIEDGKIEQKFF